MDVPRFTFLHSYESTGRYYESITAAGLVRPFTGIRLVNSTLGGDSARFNSSASPGMELFDIVNSERKTLVVDRLCGGIVYRDYDYDQGLISQYAHNLGDLFMGFQIHETVSNILHEWQNFLKISDDLRHRPVRETDLNNPDFPQPLTYGSLAYDWDDYVGRQFPADFAEMWENVFTAFRKKLKAVSDFGVYVEGACCGELAFAHMYKNGARWCELEVGPWAAIKIQFGVSALRGAATAYNKPWGIYFAPWGPQGCTSMIPLEQNCWNAPLSFFPQETHEPKPEHGPSSALHRNILFYSYIAQARCLYEEWGCECNLLDLDKPDLSSYGMVTKEFLDFVEDNPDCGTPVTPVALVLDVSQPPPTHLDQMLESGKTMTWYNARPIDYVWAEIKDAIFKTNPTYYDFAILSICPSIVSDVYDIVPSDTPTEILDRYDTVIKIDQNTDPEDVLRTLIEASPFEKDGILPLQINYRESDEKWILAVYNPFGAKRGDVYNTGSELDESMNKQMRVALKYGHLRECRVLHKWNEKSSVELDGNSLVFELSPGGMLITECC